MAGRSGSNSRQVIWYDSKTMKALRLLPVLVFSLLLAAQQIDLVKELRFRQIGPFRGGRSVAVAGVPSQPDTYYFGAVGGGVFKTTDSGLSWLPVSDGQFKTGSVGALALPVNGGSAASSSAEQPARINEYIRRRMEVFMGVIIAEWLRVKSRKCSLADVLWNGICCRIEPGEHAQSHWASKAHIRMRSATGLMAWSFCGV